MLQRLDIYKGFSMTLGTCVGWPFPGGTLKVRETTVLSPAKSFIAVGTLTDWIIASAIGLDAIEGRPPGNPSSWALNQESAWRGQDQHRLETHAKTHTEV